MFKPAGVDMNIDIRVYAELELVRLVEQGVELPDHLISIGNPRLPWLRPRPGEFVPPQFRGRFKRIMRLNFFDCERKDLLGEVRPKRIPERRDVERVIRFYRQTQDQASGYVVHCWGGISRSTAVALGLLFLACGSEDEAARQLVAIRPEAGPHRLILEFFDRLLGCHLAETGQIMREQRMDELRQTLLVQFAEITAAMDAELEELEAFEDTGE